MNQKRKKWLVLFLSLLLLLCGCVFTGCGGDASSGEPATCTIEISCATVLDHLEELKEPKKSLYPRMDYPKKDNSLFYHRRVSLIF